MKFRKFYLYGGLSLLILAALAVGGYYYTLNRYAKEMDKLMDIFLAEMFIEDAPQEQEAGKENNSASVQNNQNNDPSSRTTDSDPQPSTSTEKSEELKELEELEEKLSPAFKDLELKDQLFILQLLRKFSVDELQEMYRLYSAGGQSRRELLKRIEQKFTPEELQHIKELFLKNKDLF